MKGRNEMKGKRELLIGLVMMGAFFVWTLLIQCIDVKTAGESLTEVGFSSFNVWFYHLTGAHMMLYTITDWLGLVPIVICLCFGVLGFRQLVKRRSLLRVDGDILILGVYYILVIVVYLAFEMIPINYRPVLINGMAEASYPSSTTLLVLSVMPTLKFQVDRRIENTLIKSVITVFVIVFSIFMVACRLISGVHWATDIVGSVLLSYSLFMFYCAAVGLTSRKEAIKDGV